MLFYFLNSVLYCNKALELMFDLIKLVILINFKKFYKYFLILILLIWISSIFFSYDYLPNYGGIINKEILKIINFFSNILWITSKILLLKIMLITQLY